MPASSKSATIGAWSEIANQSSWLNASHETSRSARSKVGSCEGAGEVLDRSGSAQAYDFETAGLAGGCGHDLARVYLYRTS